MSVLAGEREAPRVGAAAVSGGVGLALMIVAIAAAWAFELVGGYVPCALCLQQRIPYYVAIPVALLALALMGRAPQVAAGLFALSAIVIASSAGLGAYHAGAEWGFWPGPATCGGGAPVRDAGSLLAAIEETRLVSCTDAPGRVLGLSFAGWNVAAAAAAAIALLGAGVRLLSARRWT